MYQLSVIKKGLIKAQMQLHYTNGRLEYMGKRLIIFTGQLSGESGQLKILAGQLSGEGGQLKI